MKCILCLSASNVEPILTEDARQYWRCGCCALVFLSESLRLNEEEEKRRYMQHENSVASPGYLSYLDCLAAPVVERLAQGARGLDFGCGPTEGMRALLEKRGFFVSSYDPFFFPREELLNINYDFVLCSEAAEHFYRPRQEFARINSLLKPQGFFGLRTLLQPSAADFADWYYRRDPTHVVFYAEPSLQWLAREFGWELLLLESPVAIFRKGAEGR